VGQPKFLSWPWYSLSEINILQNPFQFFTGLPALTIGITEIYCFFTAQIVLQIFSGSRLHTLLPCPLCSPVPSAPLLPFRQIPPTRRNSTTGDLTVIYIGHPYQYPKTPRSTGTHLQNMACDTPSLRLIWLTLDVRKWPDFSPLEVLANGVRLYLTQSQPQPVQSRTTLIDHHDPVWRTDP